MKILAESLNKVDEIIKRNHEWHEESIALGLISDEEKLRMLKRDLYSEVRLSNPNQQKILNLTSAIQLLEEIKNAELNREREILKLKLTFWGQFNEICNVVLILGIFLVIGSFANQFICTNLNSQLCNKSRIPTPVEKLENFFKN